MSRSKVDETILIELAPKNALLSVDSFLDVINASLDILRSIDKQTSADHKKTARWQIAGASMNTPLKFSIIGQANTSERVSEIVEIYLDGMLALENEGPSAPVHFDLEALQKAKDIVAVLNDGVSSIRLVSGNTVAVPTQRVAANVDALNAVAYSSFGSVDGRLETLTVHNGPRFVIYDLLHNNEVRCSFDSSRLPEVTGAFTKRVRVYGKIEYGKDGRPRSIKVDGGPHILRDRTQLPQAKDLEGIDVAGGLESAEYIRGLRDE